MKHSTRLYVYTFIIALLLPVLAMANEEATLQNDKFFALSHLTQNLKEACISDYKRRLGTELIPEGDMLFNDQLTQSVSTALFWNNAQRGVAFTLPVKKQSDNSVTKIACLYGVQDHGLTFQMSQRFTAAN